MHDDSARGPSRRDFLVMGTGVFAVSALGLALARRRVVRRTVPVMGTIAEIAVVGRDERTAHGAIDAAIAELRAVERSMSRFDPSSDIGRANTAAHRDAVRVGAATGFVTAEALRWAAAGGAFDPAIGRAVALWSVGTRTAPPPADAVTRLAGRALYRGVDLDVGSSGARVAFENADIALDLGGIAKGFAVDRAVAALREWGVRDALVNAGGDLFAMGESLDGEPWEVGVRSPTEPGSIIATVPLRDGAIATSGDYEQFFLHAGRRYHHLLDPRTAAPRAASMHSISVAAHTCMDADAGATAVFGMEPAAARAVLQRAAPGASLLALA
jgi:thiamine biosynthesis lipoprotein